MLYHKSLQSQTHTEQRELALQHGRDSPLQVEIIRRAGARRKHHQVRLHYASVYLRLQEVGERAAAPQGQHSGSGLAQVVRQSVHEAAFNGQNSYSSLYFHLSSTARVEPVFVIHQQHNLALRYGGDHFSGGGRGWKVRSADGVQQRRCF